MLVSTDDQSRASQQDHGGFNKRPERGVTRRLMVVSIGDQSVLTEQSVNDKETGADPSDWRISRLWTV